MKRSFYKVTKEIMENAPENLKNYLEKHAMYWAPEIRWLQLSAVVNKFVKPSSSDENSIVIYSILMDKTVEEVIDMFLRDGV